MSAAKKWGMTLAMAACFGLVAGGVFIGTAAVGTKVIGTATEQKQEVTIPTTTTTTAADSSDTSDTVKSNRRDVRERCCIECDAVSGSNFYDNGGRS